MSALIFFLSFALISSLFTLFSSLLLLLLLPLLLGGRQQKGEWGEGGEKEEGGKETGKGGREALFSHIFPLFFNFNKDYEHRFLKTQREIERIFDDFILSFGGFESNRCGENNGTCYFDTAIHL